MSNFVKKDRQRIIDNYLAETGRNLYVAAEFVDWLKDRPDHELHQSFFGQGDEEAARQYRIGMARNLASGLRISVSSQEVDQSSMVIKITTREYPALISPIAGRRDGGGYQPFDATNPAAMAELRDQAATSLRSWLERYRGAAESGGVDLTPVEEIVARLSRGVAQSA